MPVVFICYRREQSGGHAGRLYDRFRQEFGDDNVFMDVAIEPGVNFKKQIEQAVGASSVLVSVIGAQWTTDQLTNPRDWVRLELETAFREEKRVIPALVQGARMPDPGQLPEHLEDLSYLNAIELSDSRWEFDVGRLVMAIRKIVGAVEPVELVEPAAAPAAPAVSGSRPYRLEREARAALAHGVTAVAAAVAPTLGPRGEYVVLTGETGRRRTREGHAITRAFSLLDTAEQEGAQLINEMAAELHAAAGGGVTVAALLAGALVEQTVAAESSGRKRPRLVTGMGEAVTRVAERIAEAAKPVEDKALVARVAAVAAEDADIGEIVAEALDRVGVDGAVVVEAGQRLGMDLEFTEGLRFDKGWISPQMVTDRERMEAILEDPFILITYEKIGPVRVLLSVLEHVIQTGKPLLIIAEDVEGEALATLIVNKVRGTLTTVAVKAPGFGDRRKRMLDDMAIVTGGEAIAEERGLELETTELAELGRARRVIVAQDSTTIVDGAGDPAAVEARMEQIKEEIEETDSDWDREKLQERLAKLGGGVAVIVVNAATEAEIRETQERVEGALRAATAALEDGYVAGGGVALLDAAAAIDLEAFEDEDERAGAEIVLRALEAPLRQIAESAGRSGDEVVAALRAAGPGHVFDALSGRVIASDDDAAPIDPATMPRLALVQAAALTERVLTTQGVLPAPRAAPPPEPVDAVDVG
jgi:chaperonin GroEL